MILLSNFSHPVMPAAGRCIALSAFAFAYFSLEP